MCAHKYALAYNLITDINLCNPQVLPPNPLCTVAHARCGGGSAEQFLQHHTLRRNDLFAADMPGQAAAAPLCWLPRQPTNFAPAVEQRGTRNEYIIITAAAAQCEDDTIDAGGRAVSSREHSNIYWNPPAFAMIAESS